MKPSETDGPPARTILIIEDEPDVRQGLRTVFEAEGFRVDETADGALGLERALAETPDIIILDLMIPGLDGLQVCRKLRERGSTTPILILTAKTGDVDKVLGFELGADDYVTKPFSVLELVARVKALLRRLEPRPRNEDRVSVGAAVVDLRRYKVEKRGEVAELYHYEVEILKLLLDREGEVVSRNQILNGVWGADSFPTSRTVDFHICNLRKKIEEDPAKPTHILTVHGAGYRFLR